MIKNQATPYLAFNGNAKEALDFYKEVFSGEVTRIQTYGEADYPTPPGADHFIIHSEFRKDALSFMAADTFPGSTIQSGNQISLMIEFESEEEIVSVYKALQNGGTKIMELQDTFWGAKYGKMKDKFGITWDLNYTKES